jgi:iron complex transport system substrate-binding protein
MEEVIVWQPQMIFVGYGQGHQTGLAQRLCNDRRWNVIPAARTGAFHEVPTVPFGWCDRPPGPNRFIGLRWMAWRMYPQRIPWNMADETRRFFSLFYHRDLTDDELAAIIPSSSTTEAQR